MFQDGGFELQRMDQGPMEAKRQLQFPLPAKVWAKIGREVMYSTIIRHFLIGTLLPKFLGSFFCLA